MNEQTFLIKKTIPEESHVLIEYLDGAMLLDDGRVGMESCSNTDKRAKRFATEDEARETASKLCMAFPDETISIVTEGSSL